MVKAKSKKEEELVNILSTDTIDANTVIESAIIQGEPEMDVLTDEIIAELNVEAKIESDAVENSVEEELKRHDEFLSRKYDGEPDVIPSELEIFVNGLRVLAEFSPLKSKINRLLDEIEQVFKH